MGSVGNPDNPSLGDAPFKSIRLGPYALDIHRFNFRRSGRILRQRLWISQVAERMG